MDIGLVTKENFCEVMSIVFMGALATAILTDGVDVFGSEVGEKPIAPFWAMLIVTLAMFAVWMACRWVRTKMP